MQLARRPQQHHQQLESDIQMPTPDEVAATLPDRFPVTVLMARRELRDHPWIDHRWEAVGVTTGTRDDTVDSPVTVMETEVSREVLYGGYWVQLHRDECESYYHNLRAPDPRCYVLTRPGEDDEPAPFLVSLSFDEANAYAEGEDVEVFPVAMPPELYRWTEAFVLAHYVPQPRKKRKRDDWKEVHR
jgi:hypothetical protein